MTKHHLIYMHIQLRAFFLKSLVSESRPLRIQMHHYHAHASNLTIVSDADGNMSMKSWTKRLTS